MNCGVGIVEWFRWFHSILKREEEEAIAVSLQRSTAPPMTTTQINQNSTTIRRKEQVNEQNSVLFSITAYGAKAQAGKCNNLQSTGASEWI